MNSSNKILKYPFLNVPKLFSFVIYNINYKQKSLLLIRNYYLNYLKKQNFLRSLE